MVIKKRIGLFLSALLVVSIIPINYYVKNRAAEKYQTIQIDGHVRDWKNVTERKSNDSDVIWWKVCSDDKYMYLAAMTVNGGKESKFFDKHINIEGFGYVYAHYSNSTKEPIVMDNKDKYIGNEAQYSFRDEGTGSGIFNEVKIPLSYIGGKKSVTFAGTAVSAASIQDLKNVKNVDWNPDDVDVIDGKEKEKETYNGIKIDGKFDDWKNSNVNMTNVSGNTNLSKAAAVWDGTNLYIYLKENDKEKDGNLVKNLLSTESGFTIQTDKNQKTLFTLKEGGKGQFYVGLGKDAKREAGASVRYNNHEYEICITNSLIKGVTADTKKLTFASHTASGDMSIIRNIENLKGVEKKGNKRPLIDTSLIKYDGDFSEWEKYPKKNTMNKGRVAAEYNAYYKEDGENPFTHKKEGVIIGHFKTKDKELARAWLRTGKITISGNGKSKVLTARYEKRNAFFMPSKTFDTVAGVNGKNARLKHMKVKNYFTLVDGRIANNPMSMKNRNKWKSHCIGKMQGTIDWNGDIEMEYVVPMKEFAGNGKITVDVPHIGPVEIAGASTGAILGILLAFAVVGGVLLYRKKKEGEFFPGIDDDDKKKRKMIAAA